MSRKGLVLIGSSNAHWPSCTVAGSGRTSGGAEPSSLWSPWGSGCPAPRGSGWDTCRRPAQPWPRPSSPSSDWHPGCRRRPSLARNLTRRTVVNHLQRFCLGSRLRTLTCRSKLSQKLRPHPHDDLHGGLREEVLLAESSFPAVTASFLPRLQRSTKTRTEVNFSTTVAHKKCLLLQELIQNKNYNSI